MKNNDEPNPSGINDKCWLPKSATVPQFIKQTYSIPVQALVNSIRLFEQTIDESIVSIENAATRRDHTQSIVANVICRLTRICVILDPITINTAAIVINDDQKTQAYNDFFGIHEIADMDVLEFAKVDAQITYAVLTEFINAGMDEFEVINYLRAILLRWNFIKNALPENDASQTHSITDEKEFFIPVNANLSIVDDPVGISFYRWRISHYAFVLDAIYANLFLERASNELDTHHEIEAAIAIQKAGVSLRATTVSMLLGSKMPKVVYNDYVRPAMGLGFSGNDNSWWNKLDKTRKAFITKAKVHNSPIITQALIDFHEKFLQDIELHTWVASKLVGTRTSLTVDEINLYCDETERNERFATADLRSLHYLRQSEFEFLNYYPILRQLFNAKN